MSAFRISTIRYFDRCPQCRQRVDWEITYDCQPADIHRTEQTHRCCPRGLLPATLLTAGLYEPNGDPMEHAA